MALTAELVYNALGTVNDPDLHRDLVTLEMIKDVRVDGADVAIDVELTTPACPLKDKIRDDIEAAVRQHGAAGGAPVSEVVVNFSADVRAAATTANRESALPGVRHVIAVGAGKGGVGKSSVATILALGLTRHGARCGLLDGDIYGPSLTTLLGLDDVPAAPPKGNILAPFEVFGIKTMTIGKLVPPDKALIWRGPMAHGAFKQLATQTDWGELDYLIVDLPPGTGDIPLSLTQILPLSGAVIVCTPQKVAIDDARRAVRMFEQLDVAILGIVENMSCFICGHGERYDIFGSGGAEALAKEVHAPLLGSIPIDMRVSRHGDAGTPLANWVGGDDLAGTLDSICKNLAAQISIATISGKYVQPTLSVS